MNLLSIGQDFFRWPFWSGLSSMLRLVLLCYLGLWVFGVFFSDPLIFPCPPPSYVSLPGQVKILTPDGIGLVAQWLPHPGARLTLLYSHGNGEDLGYDQEVLNALGSLGFNLLAYDFRGYGRSEGHPNERGLLTDITTVYHYLAEDLHVPTSEIVVHGRSLGSGPSTYLASREKVGGLILESAYTSIFTNPFPWLWFPCDKFPSLTWIKQVHCPVLIIHGTADQVIPFARGQKLWTTASAPKRHLWVEGAGHNDVMIRAPEQYRSTLREFAQLVLSNPKPMALFDGR